MEKVVEKQITEMGLKIYGNARRSVQFCRSGKEKTCNTKPGHLSGMRHHLDTRSDRHVTIRKRATEDKPATEGIVMKPTTYDGTWSWNDYKCHILACAERNTSNWA